MYLIPSFLSIFLFLYFVVKDTNIRNPAVVTIAIIKMFMSHGTP